ncbi:MAG: hypothetical protein ACK5X7_09815, partial [Pseudanabaena sp.]
GFAKKVFSSELSDSFSCLQNPLPLSNVIVFRNAGFTGSNSLIVTLFTSAIILALTLANITFACLRRVFIFSCAVSGK